MHVHFKRETNKFLIDLQLILQLNESSHHPAKFSMCLMNWIENHVVLATWFRLEWTSSNQKYNQF